ncbi:MAG: T9SS type A sorting domain-containing protein [Planctomycetes bacterium]|nr:T9SS type A sorting domain-containing protein [Planctomycetota bacterium]
MKKLIILSIILLWPMAIFAQTDIVFFSDSPDGDEFYDSSWGYYTVPAYLELINGSKFPVDPDHPYLGQHSLRLHWTSANGGDWGIAVASVDWPGHDLTDYDSLQYWINAPAGIPQAALPDLALEDLNNHKSTRVWIAEYFNGVDNDPVTWQKVTVPLDAFEPGPENCDFTQIKTIYHFQRETDGNEHLAWLDEIRIVGEGAEPPDLPSFTAIAYDSRIDLIWNMVDHEGLLGYHIYRATSPEMTFELLHSEPVSSQITVFSDFIGQNEQTYYYFLTIVTGSGESEPTPIVSASTYAMTTEELIDSVQEATFRFFYDYGHPVSGLARERNGSGNTCTSGGSGMGLMTLMVGAEREFAPRDSVAARILKILRFMQDTTPRYHGVWSHWINGITGATIPFSTYDDGGDLIETAFFIQGVLTVRQYFDADNPVESELRQRATELWESVDWDWYRRYQNGNRLYWHWSPNYGWQMNMPIVGFNEGMIAYLLAIASPTHPIPVQSYYLGWCNSANYVNGYDYYGYHLWVGPPYGGPLFFTHYSYLGFDPRDKSDQYCNYFDNNRNISLINRAYCIDNPDYHAGYSDLVWGLTASDDPWGYEAHSPTNDNGTITPTAAISAMPYVPDESIATLEHFYHEYGSQLWGPFGFYDAFNLDENWFADSYIAIDQGTIGPMIENYRSQLCWNMFMSNPEIPVMLNNIGWIDETIEIEKPDLTLEQGFQLEQNFPNPCLLNSSKGNPGTKIRFSLARQNPVTLHVYNTAGQRVAALYSGEELSAGAHEVNFEAANLAAGLYLYRLETPGFQKTKTMVVIK